MSNLINCPARVDKDDLEWFRKNYPHGSWSWFVRTSLRYFRELHSHDPSSILKEAVIQTEESFAQEGLVSLEPFESQYRAHEDED